MDKTRKLAQAVMHEDEAKMIRAARAENKPWDECGIEEKVERLRGALRDLRWGLNDVRRRTAHFENHQHDALGQIVVPLNPRFSQGEASARDLLA